MKMKKLVSVICAAALLTSAFASALPAGAEERGESAYGVSSKVTIAGSKDPDIPSADLDEENEEDEEEKPEAETFTSGDYEYQIASKDMLEDGLESLEGTVKITKYSGSESDVTVPAEIDGKKVTWIALEVFKDNKIVEKVTIPEGVVQVGHQVFMGCEKLTQVSFPDSLRILGSGVFRDCKSIVEVTVPDSVEETGIGMFQGCESLKKVTLPRYGVSPYMYSGCSSLEYAPLEYDKSKLPEFAMPWIPHRVFEKCTSLTEVTIPDYIEKIYEGAFADCTNLEKVVFPGNTEIIDGDPAEGDEDVFVRCPKLTICGHKDSNAEKYAKEHDIPFVDIDEEHGEPIFPEYTTSGDFNYVLNGGGAVKIVEYIGSEKEAAFPSEIDGVTVNAIGTRIVQGQKPDDFKGYSALESIVLPDTIVEIEPTAFIMSDNLKSVKMTDSVRVIGGGAFAGCPLESIELSSNVELIPDHCFTECQFTSIEIPEGVKVIDSTAFWKCSKLKEIVLPASAESVRDGAFAGCDSLSDVTFLGENTEIGKDAFSDRDGSSVKPVIHGYKGSSAEKIANAAGMEFKPLDEQEETVDYACKDTEEVSYKPGSDVELTFTFSRAEDDDKTFELFVSVMVDGVLVDPSNYTVTKGSLVVTFKKEFLASLAPGEHTMTVNFEDGAAEKSFTVEQSSGSDDPDTGKSSFAYGDADKDTFITANDALMILRSSVGLETFDEELTKISDIDEDGFVTANDALAVLRASVGFADDNNVGKNLRSH